MSSKLALGFPEFILGMDKSTHHTTYEFEDFRLDTAHLMLYAHGAEVQLVPKAAKTLLVLVRHAGSIVSKEELLEAVWPDAIVEESNLFAYLTLLRKTLGHQDDGSPYIETLRGRGYRFNGLVRVVHETGANKSESDKTISTQLDPPATVSPRAHISSPRKRYVVLISLAATL